MRIGHPNAIEKLKQSTWRPSRDYFGFSPEGDFLVVAQHRDSDIVDRSNYRCAYWYLQKEASEFQDPPEEQYRDGLSPRSAGWVYDFRAGHWAVGWVEYLMVRADAPQEILEAAGDILCSIDDYPVLNEDDLAELQWEEAQECWESLSIRDRVDVLKGTEVSRFAARRPDLPYDSGGVLWDRLVR